MRAFSGVMMASRRTLLIVAGYTAAALAWILFSDALVYSALSDDDLLRVVSSAKGVLFVAVTSLVLYLLMASVARSDANHEQRLQIALQGANASWWDWDIAANRIYYSRRWWETLGYRPGELSSDPELWRRLLHPEDREWVEDYIRENMEGAREQVELDIRLRHRDGHYLPIRARGRILRDARGRAVRIAGVNIDRSGDAQIREERRLAQMVFANASEGIMVTDASGTILEVNPAFESVTGYSRAEAVGNNPRMLHSGRQDTQTYREMWDSLEAVGWWRGEIWNRRKTGEVYPEWLTISAVEGDNGKVTHYIGMFSDLSSIKRTEKKLDFLAHYDPLTHLPNRVLLHERLSRGIARARRSGSLLAVMFLNLDRFQNVNASMGYTVGDDVLREIAHRISAEIRAEDTLARPGGDEFALMFEDETSVAHIEAIARKVLATCAQPLVVGEHAVTITASLGISVFPNDGESPGVLLSNADTAMHEAKKHGQNGHRFYSPELTAGLFERLMMEVALRGAVSREQLCLHYQPQVDLATGRLVGVEALVRWNHPDLGLVPPAQFIPLAEEIGVIGEIGKWVLEEACAQQARWLAEGVDVPCVAVNLSVRQLASESIVDDVASVLSASGLNPGQLELELTESMIMHEAGKALETLNGLKQLGVKLAVDDFGTGYSSLSYLKLFPIDRLKIDRSFVCDIGSDANDEAIVRAVVALARSLDLETIAEGVENDEQVAFLRGEGCTTGQGYLFGRPVTAAEITAARFGG